MKKIFNKGFPKSKKELVEKAIPKALEFMQAKYPQINFNEAVVRFSSTRNGSNYYHASVNNATGFINISTRDKIYLYKRVSVKLTAPHGGLLVGCELQVVSALIHELTHYVQGIEKRLFSEVETTINEIEYLKNNEPFWYSKLVPVR